MKPTVPTSASSKFVRYATATAAAFGAAAATNAQFIGDYSLESPPAGTFNNPASPSTFGQWHLTEVSSNLDETTVVTTTNGASLGLFAMVGPSATYVSLDFSTVAAASGNVSFDYSTVFAGSGYSFRFYDNSGYVLSVFGSGSSTATFAVTSGETFGFRLTSAYSSGSYVGATITNFSAPMAAIPEAGTTGLLAGCAALGFVGLVGARRSRQRAT